MRAARFSPGQRLLGVFVLTIFVPGVLLAVFGARALWQERNLSRRQSQDRLDYAADSAVRVLATELERLRPSQAWPRDGSWAYVDEGVVTPAGVLPYELRAPVRPAALDPNVERAKSAEDGMRPERVVDLYRGLLTSTSSAGLPEVRHRLARALQAAGQPAEADQIWRQVEAAGGWIGALPAELVAGFERAAMGTGGDAGAARAFYERLTQGKWRLEKARYLYYSSTIRQHVTPSADEDRAIKLAEAVEEALAARAASGYFVFHGERPSAVLVVSRQFLGALLAPRLAAVADNELGVTRLSADGQTIFGAEAAEPRALRGIERGGVAWSVEVAPRDAAAFLAGNRQRINLYLGLLVLVLVALGAGGYMAIRTVRRELEVARLKAEFVSTVSHEFRSPLTGIRQLGEMLARGRVSDETKRQQYYDLIVRESERLGRLVENILDFSRMEEGRKEYRVESIEPAAWLRAVADEFRAEASRAGCELQTAIPDYLPSIAGDREALSTAVRNLLDNAVKYSPGADAVWLEAEAAGEGVRITVRDRGVGIPQREQTQIFDKFYRGEGESSKKIKGAGLGLSLVRHIVESHQGTITVESREGQGSTFSIHLARAI